MAGPLDGIRILDLTRYLPGPFCVLLLADMGADVIKIDMPEHKEATRGGFPARGSFGPAVQLSEVESRAYSVLTRNSRSVILDLTDEKARQTYYKLVKTADVVVEDFRPRVAKKLGIDFETLKKFNSDIIYCAVTGYGQEGPYSQYAGFDPNFIAVGGLLGLSGDREGNHVLPAIPVADLTGGMLGALGIVMGILARMKGIGGQFIDISLVDGITYLIGTRLGPLFFSKGVTPVRGRRLPHVYEAKDGKFLCFSFGTFKFWENACRVLGLDEHIPDWRYVQALGLEDQMENPGEVLKKREEIVRKISNIIVTKNRETWLSLLSKADVCVSPVYSLDETFSDPQVVYRNMVRELEHPELGKVRQVGIPIKMSKTPGEIRRFAPKRGEHSQEILGGLQKPASGGTQP